MVSIVQPKSKFGLKLGFLRLKLRGEYSSLLDHMGDLKKREGVINALCSRHATNGE